MNWSLSPTFPKCDFFSSLQMRIALETFLTMVHFPIDPSIGSKIVHCLLQPLPSPCICPGVWGHPSTRMNPSSLPQVVCHYHSISPRLKTPMEYLSWWKTYANTWSGVLHCVFMSITPRPPSFFPCKPLARQPLVFAWHSHQPLSTNIVFWTYLFDQ